MFDKFIDYINTHKLIESEENILLSVSGGKDSMVLATLFRLAKIPHGIAHINHKTRGKENTIEEKLISEYCKLYDLPFYRTELNLSFAKKSNFQSRSRAYRYDWLTNIASSKNYQKIATGHHLQDSVETFFINLTRSSGLNGLSGISPKRGNIIRPLLFATDVEIKEFIDKHNIAYLEDSSNNSEKYKRNLIRHKLIPQLKKVGKGSLKTTNSSILFLSQANDLLIHLINKNVAPFLEQKGPYFVVLLEGIKKMHSRETVLFYVLSKFQFNMASVSNILSSARSGATFFSDSHIAILERNKLYIKTKEIEDSVNVTIDKDGVYNLPWGEKFMVQSVDHLEFGNVKNVEYLGFKDDPYPLVLRSKKSGDSFRPLGLNGKNQKLKDFIINTKMDLIQKERLTVVEKDHEICYVVGHRISEKWKVTPNSQYFLKTTLLTG